MKSPLPLKRKRASVFCENSLGTAQILCNLLFFKENFYEKGRLSFSHAFNTLWKTSEI